MPLFQKPTEVYEKMVTIFGGSDFDYFPTRQRGYLPLDNELLDPALYPWGFPEFGSISDVSVYRSPRVFQYNLTLPLVVMTFADAGDPTNLVVNDGTNTNKGIMDIVKDIGQVFWGNWKLNQFDVAGVRDWTIGRVGFPSVLSVQRLLVNPFVRGIQTDFVFHITETTPAP